MKKRLALLLALLLLLPAVLGCNVDRTPIDAATFQTKAEEAGLLVLDAADQVDEGVVDAWLIAVAGDDSIDYQIEFIIVPTEAQAINAYQENYATFEGKKGGTSSYASTTMGNFAYYKLTTNGRYYVISRIGNTFIYVDAPETYRTAINDFLKGIGY